MLRSPENKFAWLYSLFSGEILSVRACARACVRVFWEILGTNNFHTPNPNPIPGYYMKKRKHSAILTCFICQATLGESIEHITLLWNYNTSGPWSNTVHGSWWFISVHVSILPESFLIPSSVCVGYVFFSFCFLPLFRFTFKVLKGNDTICWNKLGKIFLADKQLFAFEHPCSFSTLLFL